MSTKVGCQREQAAKQKQKEWDSKQNDHQDWQNQRNNMIKRKEEAELKAKQAEEKKAAKSLGQYQNGRREIERR